MNCSCAYGKPTCDCAGMPYELADTEPGCYLGDAEERYDDEAWALLKWLVCGVVFTIAAFVLAPYVWKALQ